MFVRRKAAPLGLQVIPAHDGTTAKKFLRVAKAEKDRASIERSSNPQPLLDRTDPKSRFALGHKSVPDGLMCGGMPVVFKGNLLRSALPSEVAPA